MVLSIRSGSGAASNSSARRRALRGADAVVLRAMAGFAVLVAVLFFAIPVQADEIEPEPEPVPQAEPEPQPEPEPEPVPDVVSEEEELSEPSWIPSIETGFETFDYNVDTTVVNHITQPLQNPDIIPGEWGGTQHEAERQLMFRIGGELMGPMFEDLPGHPRLFIKGGVQIRTFSSDKIFGTGSPFVDGEPENAIGRYNGRGNRFGVVFPADFTGQGGEISARFQDPSWYAGLGVAFSVPITTNLLVYIKPSVQYSMEKIDLPAGLTTVLETTPPGTVDPSPCGTPPFPTPCLRTFDVYRSRTTATATDHSVGAGLEVAVVPFRSARPIRFSFYAEARFLWLVSDDTTEFADPGGVASYSVVRDDFNINGGGGLRFSWVGFD
jgi:hypothetical protein